VDFRRRLERVRERIAMACRRVGRDPADVTIVVVTKYVGVEEIRMLLDAGANDFGENRLQPAIPKVTLFKNRAKWHFIGHLQTNKVKEVVKHFDTIHSLDRLSLGQEINRRAAELGKVIPCFLQVNISGEPSKHGCPADAAGALYEELRHLPYIAVRGLMTMAPAVSHPEEARAVFQALRELRDRLAREYGAEDTLRELSMGMSNDFEVAVEEGATYVRLGSVLVKEAVLS
jgi:pyridoxal phosphate enzyme (YggS family)